MDGYLESESLMSTSALVELAREREREMQDIARMEHFLSGNSNDRQSRYARFMPKVGDRLVNYGTWIKAHYSGQQTYHAN